MSKVVNIVTKKPHKGNVQDWEDIPSLRQLRILMHHRLRECIRRKITFKSLEEKSGVKSATISRIAHHVGTRTWLGTIHKLAPHLGIEVTAKALKDW